MRYEYYDYPEDFIFEYQEQVQNTTREDILEVAQEYLQPEQLATLVVGNINNMNPPLNSLDREVTMVDVSIPELTQG